MGSILLATKVEEECRPARSIIATVAHLYRRRRLRYGDDDVLDVESLATHKLSLDDGPKAYETFQKKEDGMIKTLLQPHGPA